MTDKPIPVVALISGRGSNLQALIDTAPDIGIRVAAVISNIADAAGLQRARDAGIATAVLDHKAYPDRDRYDEALMACIDRFQPALVTLAGFMRILGAAFIQHYQGRLFNIHPSLLPAYRGMNTHQRALDAGEIEHGCTVHFVSEELDGGPIVIQSRVAVHRDDDEQRLAARVLEREHLIYPLVVGWFAAGRLRLEHGKPMLDGNIIPPNGVDYDSPGTTQ
jgi:phosphoribosylglycinamide formyltransferase-1